MRATRASATIWARSSPTSSSFDHRARQAVYGAEHVNVQPYSGSPANFAAYLALADPGDGSRHGPAPRRAPDPRLEGQLLGQASSTRTTTRSTATPSASTTTPCASWPTSSTPRSSSRPQSAYPPDRLRGLRRDRPRGRRGLLDRHGPHLRPGRRRRSPLSSPPRRRRHHHHAQEPARARARGMILCKETSTPRPSTAPSSPARRAGRTCTPSPRWPWRSRRRCNRL